MWYDFSQMTCPRCGKPHGLAIDVPDHTKFTITGKLVLECDCGYSFSAETEDGTPAMTLVGNAFEAKLS